jgi:pimeloyl-ACP methyl ester carboxylesterase
MTQTLREALSEASWEEWEDITCPALIVRAGNGVVDSDTAEEMARRLPSARLVEIAEAAHDLHLDRPDEWRQALTGFLDAVDDQTT